MIVWQEQVVQLIIDVAGMTASKADELRRAFARANNEHLLATLRERFLAGAEANAVPPDVAERIFAKINGHYMFPESHSHVFAIAAYQAAWLKRHHPLEFFVALANNQPMGFYPMETLKQAARRFGVPFLNPCVNRSQVRCVPEAGSARLGLSMVKDIGPESVQLIVVERERHGPYVDAGELVRRTGIKPQSLRSLIEAGALDAVTPNCCEALWEAGLSIRPSGSGQRSFPVVGTELPPRFDDVSDYDKMIGEYRVLGIYPSGHVMEFIRPTLDSSVLTTTEVYDAQEGRRVCVAGWPIARQHPRGPDGTVFVTIEDETGDVQSIIRPQVFARCRRALSYSLIMISGRIDRWDGTGPTSSPRRRSDWPAHPPTQSPRLALNWIAALLSGNMRHR